MLIHSAQVIDRLLKRAIEQASELAGPMSQDANTFRLVREDFLKETTRRE